MQTHGVHNCIRSTRIITEIVTKQPCVSITGSRRA